MKRLAFMVLLVGGMFATAIGSTQASPARAPAQRHSATPRHGGAQTAGAAASRSMTGISVPGPACYRDTGTITRPRVYRLIPATVAISIPFYVCPGSNTYIPRQRHHRSGSWPANANANGNLGGGSIGSSRIVPTPSPQVPFYTVCQRTPGNTTTADPRLQRQFAEPRLRVNQSEFRRVEVRVQPSRPPW